MKNESILGAQALFASAALALLSSCLSGCYLPPSMFERASWGPPPEYWQEQGRYRQGTAGQPGTQALDPDADQPAAELDPDVPGAARVSDPEQTDPMGESAETKGAANAPEPLYAWDGGVVEGAPRGRVTAQDAPRGLETPPSGRMHIIELYQQVLEERDALAHENQELRRHLEETSIALDAKTKAADELTARVAALEEARTALMNDNQTIAARLVQAQIRRLEAEKLLLESRIEAERAKAEETARAAAAAQAKSGKPKPAPKAGEGAHE